MERVTSKCNWRSHRQLSARAVVSAHLTSTRHDHAIAVLECAQVYSALGAAPNHVPKRLGEGGIARQRHSAAEACTATVRLAHEGIYQVQHLFPLLYVKVLSPLDDLDQTP